MAAIVVGENTNLQDGTIVHVDERLPARIGARVGVGHRAILHGCTVEDDCLIGMGSVLLNGVHIGTGSVVAAGAVVPEGTRVPRARSWWACRHASPDRWTRPCGRASGTPGSTTWPRRSGTARGRSRSLEQVCDVNCCMCRGGGVLAGCCSGRLNGLPCPSAPF